MPCRREPAQLPHGRGRHAAAAATLGELKAQDRESAARLQSETRDQFRKLLHQGYIATSVERRGDTVDYILEPAASIAGLRLPEYRPEEFED